jgi:hypothetical protein
MSEVTKEKPVIELPAESFSRREDRELALVPATNATPMSMLAMAVQKGMDVATIKDLMQLQKEWEANEARKAFNVAFAAFKAESVQIIKGVTIESGPLKGKKHADLFDVVSATMPALSKHGLSTAWRLSKDEKDWMEITCTLSHAAGHSESVSMGGMPDDGPGRNAIQARGSVKTYLERYTLTAILGLDDDGAGAEAKGMPEADYLAFKKKIEAAVTKAKAKEAWAEGVKVCEQLGDVATANKLKADLLAHATFIDNAAKAEKVSA